eukprot:1309658-Amphidinium_carterae.1
MACNNEDLDCFWENDHSGITIAPQVVFSRYIILEAKKHMNINSQTNRCKKQSSLKAASLQQQLRVLAGGAQPVLAPVGISRLSCVEASTVHKEGCADFG